MIYHNSQQLARFKAGTISINLPAKTGKDNNNNTAVITTAQPNKASLCSLIPGLLIFNIVVMTIINKVITFPPPPTLKHKGKKTN